MNLHIADFIGWVILTSIYWSILPEDFKEELGEIIGLIGWLILTVLWIVFFVIIDYNLIDLIKQINIKW
jgi:hypothetical protein